MIGWGLGVRLAIDYPLAWNSQSVIMFAGGREKGGRGGREKNNKNAKRRTGQRERGEREKDDEGRKARVREWEIELPVRSSQSRK